MDFSFVIFPSHAIRGEKTRREINDDEISVISCWIFGWEILRETNKWFFGMAHCQD